MERELATEDDSDGLERNEIELGSYCREVQRNRGEEISIGVVLYVEKV